MVAGEDESFRDFLSFNLYQDLLFSADQGEDDWDALYAEADFSPFPWLSMKWRQKFRTENMDALKPLSVIRPGSPGPAPTR